MTLQESNTRDTPHNIVLYFDAGNPVVSANVRERLVQLAPQTAASINQYLARGRIILKRNADLATFQRAVDLWIGTGAVCRFEKAPDTTESSKTGAGKSIPSPKQPPQVQSGEMVCPRCRRQQATALECRYCGIIISKAKTRPLSPPKDAAPVKAAPSAQPPVTGGWQDLVRRCHQIVQRVRSWLANGTLNKSKAARWSQRVIDAVTHLAIAWGIALVLEIGLLYLGHGMWFIYESTPVGQHYLTMTDSLATHFQYLAQINLAQLGLEVTLTALLVSLAIGAASQFLHLIRLFFEPFSFLARLVFWAVPLTGATGWWLQAQDPMIPLSIACMVSFLPMLVLLGRSVGVIQAVMPEMGTIISAAVQWSSGFKSTWDMLRERLEKFK